MEGLKAKTTSMYDGEAREIAHVKNVSDLVSKVGTSNIAHRNIVSLTNGSSVRCASFFFFMWLLRFCTDRNGMRPRTDTYCLLMRQSWFWQ